MGKRYPLVHPNVKGFLHGGDYNPDQWLHMPEIIDEDFRLMKLAHCQTFSINIFAWSKLEPAEGQYDFAWLDDIMDRLAAQGSHAILATPSGARPAWLSQTYPEVLRVEANRQRNLHGLRHNHCFTSPVYREKTNTLNRLLAERYKDHPALIMWHISNEYGGECHCELCQEAFRDYLKDKYNHDLEALNQAWWTGFWSHTYSDWSQIESPAPHGEHMIHGMNLDWKRFVTAQTINFYQNEIKPLRELTPHIPVTTNFMGDYPHMRPFLGLDYHQFAKEVDVISWDSYPAWHSGRETTAELASNVAFVHDLYRSLKDGQPFLVMESTPSLVNWHEVNKVKHKGMAHLSAMQAIAHGSDSVLYFQWRQGRGASEKFHGAVVDHSGHEHTRVFQEVADLGKQLEQLHPIAGTSVQPEVAIIYDWENHWAIDDAQGLNNTNKRYVEACQTHYRSFWKKGISVDIVGMEKDFSSYRVLIGPMLYMIKPGVAEKIEAFVKAGGIFIATYWSGIVDENDLCFLGGFPGPLRHVLGIWAEEINTLMPDEHVLMTTGNGRTYHVGQYCESIHPETASVLGHFENGCYEGQPALTVRSLEKGKAYYMASENEQSFYDEFYEDLIAGIGIQPVLSTAIPEGVSVQKRTDGSQDYVFLMNFTEEQQNMSLDSEASYENMLTGQQVPEQLQLDPYEYVILKNR
ncbi:beta-galactosidase [Bacillus safensis]|uniref:beta-galactosidase n=1 Tax=Bacillus safensis TaxID=561879 RepID=UPI0004D38D3B|nr:beta-galactosidase [Bacillus safensis]KEP28790.1 beta-galactosidase [Bacillus safensis]GMG80660.1 beta-galactosidase GanA [Bacillus safensis]